MRGYSEAVTELLLSAHSHYCAATHSVACFDGQSEGLKHVSDMHVNLQTYTFKSSVYQSNYNAIALMHME